MRRLLYALGTLALLLWALWEHYRWATTDHR